MSVEQKIDLNINSLQGGIQGWQDILELPSQQEPESDKGIWNYSNPQNLRVLESLPVSGESILESWEKYVFKPRDGVGNSTLREGLRNLVPTLRHTLTPEESYGLEKTSVKAESGQVIAPKRRSIQWVAGMFDGLTDKLNEQGLESYDKFDDYRNHPDVQLEVVQAFKRGAAGVVHAWAYNETRRVSGVVRGVNLESAQVAIETFGELEILLAEIIEKLRNQGVEVGSQIEVGRALKDLPLKAKFALIIAASILAGCGSGGDGSTSSIDNSTNPVEVEILPDDDPNKITFLAPEGSFPQLGGICPIIDEVYGDEYQACPSAPMYRNTINVQSPDGSEIIRGVTLPESGGNVLFETSTGTRLLVPPEIVVDALRQVAAPSNIGVENNPQESGGESGLIEPGSENQVQPPDSSGEGPLPLQQEEPSIDSLPRVLTFEDLQNLTEGNSGPQVGEAPQTTPDAEEGETSAEQGDTVEVWSFKITKNDEDESVKFGNITRNRTEIEEYFSGSLTASGACKTDHLSKNGDPENQWLQVDCTSNVDTARLAEFFGITEQELINLFTIQDGITREVLRKVEEVTIAAVTSTPVSGITDSGQFMTTEDYKLPIDEGLEPPSMEEDRQGLSKGFWIACLGIPTLAVTAAWFTSLYYKFKSRKRG